MFGNFAEMAKLMSKAKDIQANLKKFKEELPTMEFSASSAGSLVKVTVTGDFLVKGVEIAPEANLSNVELQQAVMVAVNSAITAAKAAAQAKMAEMTGSVGLDLPGIF